MMKTANAMLKYLALDKARRYTRAIRDNKALAIGGAVALVLSVSFGVDALYANMEAVSAFFPYVVILYSGYKALQDYPMATIPYPMLSQKMFTRRSLVGYFLVKSIVPTIGFFSIWAILGLHITQIFITSLLCNIAANVYTAYKTQALPRCTVLVTATLLCCAFASIVFMEPWFAFLCAIAPCMALVSVKSVNLDYILPYYESLYQIKTGFENKDSSMMAAGQSSFVRSAQKSSLRLAADGYGRSFSVRLEAVRLVFRKKSFIVCSLLVLSGGVSLAFYFDYDILFRIIATMMLFLIVDMYLLGLDRGERHAGEKNPILRSSTKSKIARSYAPHLLLTIYFFVLGIPILLGSNFVLVLVSVAILPLQSILISNAKGIAKNAIAYALLMAAFVVLMASVDPSGVETGILFQQMQGVGV